MLQNRSRATTLAREAFHGATTPCKAPERRARRWTMARMAMTGVMRTGTTMVKLHVSSAARDTTHMP